MQIHNVSELVQRIRVEIQKQFSYFHLVRMEYIGNSLMYSALMMFWRQISGKIVGHRRITDKYCMVSFFRTLVRILFNETAESDNCLVEWRQMTHSGENQDVWAIDGITIRDLPHLKHNRPVQ